jgi:hypothetical protein
MKDDDSLEEDPLAYNPTSIRFDEKDKMLLREMQGDAIVIDLDWYPEQYEDQEPEDGDVAILSRETLECQVMACDSMSEIHSIDEESVYEKLSWNEDMANHPILLIPVEIHKVQGPTGYYHRFWGYICQSYIDSDYVEVKKATISLPSSLSKRIAAFSEDMLNMKADPVEDSKVHMILTIYHGLEEYEVKDEKRKAHKFWNTRLIEGHRSPK